jgi:glycerol-3-phosphate dehydrogenase
MRVALVDHDTPEPIELCARDVVNATGVWVDRLRGGSPMVQPSQGAHIVVGRHFFPFDEALLLPRTVDGRVLFVVPWFGHCVIGTTDTPRDAGDLSLGQEPLPFSDEIDLILSEVSRVLHPAPSRSDILSAWAGLRPLVRPEASAGGAGQTRQLSREHAIEINPDGLVSITGGKWTSCMAMAEDLLAQLPNRPILHRQTDDRPLPVDAPDCAARVPTAAEVKWLAEQTWARTVEDVLARRSRLMFLDLRAAIEAAPAVAATLEAETGCDADLSGFMLTAQSWLARFGH